MAVRIPSATLRYLFKPLAPLRILSNAGQVPAPLAERRHPVLPPAQNAAPGTGPGPPARAVSCPRVGVEGFEGFFGLLHRFCILLQARPDKRSADLLVSELLQHVRSPRYVRACLTQVLLGLGCVAATARGDKCDADQKKQEPLRSQRLHMTLPAFFSRLRNCGAGSRARLSS